MPKFRVIRVERALRPAWPVPRVLLLAALGLATTVGSARAQTVADIAARGACSTAGVEALSAQLAEAQMCLRPGAFVRFAPHAGISLSSSRVHPYLQESARAALHRAAAEVSLTINSAFRTLADQYVLYHSGGCGLAARPGRSNHQTGRAVDVQNHSAARSALERAGCAWLGSSDPVHFDCPGSDGRADAVLAFQRLWNANHPGDRIAEDGDYGPQTESRLARSPASGFATSGCGCTPACEGDTAVTESCERVECGAVGAYCSTAAGGAPSCVSVFCVADPADAPVAHDVCLPDGRAARCDDGGGLRDAHECDAGSSCVGGACIADAPAAVPDAGRPDAGTPPGAVPPAGDAGPPTADDAGPDDWTDDDSGPPPATTSGTTRLTGGCAATRPGASGGWPSLLPAVLFAALVRRRR